MTFSFTNWISSVAGCGSFTYVSTNVDGTNLDTFITFIAASRSFSISTSNPIKINTYPIKVVGSLTAGPSAFITFNLIVKNPCESSVITPSAVLT